MNRGGRKPFPIGKCKVYLDMHGYLRTRINGKEVRLHRYVMEQHLRRKLLPTEIIHHKNGVRIDNRIENMEIVTRAQHRAIHNYGSHHSEATKEKLRNASTGNKNCIGRVLSEETKRKIGEGQRRYQELIRQQRKRIP